MIDLDDITPPHGTPIPTQHPEYPHPGEPSRTAPRIEGGRLVLADTIEAAIKTLEEVRRIARRPLDDAAAQQARSILLPEFRRLQRLSMDTGFDDRTWEAIWHQVKRIQWTLFRQ